MRALIAGATGLVGGRLLEQLLKSDDYEEIVALVRRPIGIENAKLTEKITDFDRLENAVGGVSPDRVFCCLGTTIKRAGSQAAFEKVDLKYVTDLARLTRQQGATHFMLVSSVDADPNSRVFYSRTKGRAEEAVRGLGFSAVHLFRPSLLLGERHEFRLGEAIGAPVARALAPFLRGGWRKYRPVAAATVAAAMIRAAGSTATGVQVHHFD